ncbi:MAG: HD domain-containing protein [Bacteroidetes bacterium]|nr:HD domain-containing protein [Bacteroidota bacterium]
MRKYIPINSNGFQHYDFLYSDNQRNKTSLKNTTDISKHYIKQKENFHQIDKNSLVAGHEIHFPIFTNKNFVFYIVAEASNISPGKIPSGLSDIEADFFIKNTDISLYNEYLESLSNALLFDKSREKVKTLLIKEKTKIIIRNVLSDPRSGEGVRLSAIAVENIVNSIFENRDIIYDLLSIKTHDYYTYTHSVNVAVLSIGFGVALSLSTTEIFNLGFGSILHDIGKSTIPAEILNKQGRLNRTEFLIMRNHVVEGGTILRGHKDFPESAFPAVMQHHEKLSGRGYPFGLDGVKINLFGKIAAITDTYDALTTQRPYKPALTPFAALDLISKETGSYDHQLLEVFIKMLGKVE